MTTVVGASAKVVVTVLTPRASSAPVTHPASTLSRCSFSGSPDECTTHPDAIAVELPT
jgi:hypothetical protein